MAHSNDAHWFGAQELPNYIFRDVALLQRLDWTEFIRQCRDISDLAHFENVHHPARRLLTLYKRRRNTMAHCRFWTTGHCFSAYILTHCRLGQLVKNQQVPAA